MAVLSRSWILGKGSFCLQFCATAHPELLNFRLRYLQNSHLTYVKLRRTSLNS